MSQLVLFYYENHKQYVGKVNQILSTKKTFWKLHIYVNMELNEK